MKHQRWTSAPRGDATLKEWCRKQRYYLHTEATFVGELPGFAHIEDTSHLTGM